jgi:hypothetical protein
MTIDLSTQMKPVFECLKDKLSFTDEDIQHLRNNGKIIFNDLKIKYYFNHAGQTRFKVKSSKTKDGITFSCEEIFFKPSIVTDKDIKKFEKKLSKFLGNKYENHIVD